MSKATEGRVLHVLESFFPCQGGAEKQVLTLGKHMLKRGEYPHVLVPKMCLDERDSQPVVDGVPVKRIYFPRVAIIGTVVLLANLSLYLLFNIKKHRAVHVHIANNIGAFACLIANFNNVTCVVKFTGLQEMSGGVLDQTAHSIRIRFLRWAYRKADYYQSTSREIAKRIEENGFDKTKIRLLPNGVDMSNGDIDNQLADKVYKQYELEGKLVGIYVGRLETEKAPDSLIEAWAKAFQTNDDVKLLVLGEGTLANKLEEQVKALNIGHQVHFVGFCDDVKTYMSLADFGVLPSEYEGLSNALLEFFTAGLPVIGSKVSGTEDVVTHDKTGWLFPPRDVDALSSYLQKAQAMNKDGLSDMGNVCSEWIKDFAGLESVYDRLTELYNSKDGV